MQPTYISEYIGHGLECGRWAMLMPLSNLGQRPKTNDYVHLHRFISNKAFHCKIPNENPNKHLTSSLTAFHSWLEQMHCEGESDSRCLPFHIFKTDFDINDLALYEGRSNFAQIHGQQSSRVDNNQLSWNRPKGAYHGQEILQVAGRDLVAGFHWDVSNSSTKKRITTTSEIWEVSANGYVNIYPDQHIRQGGLAKRLTLK